MIKKFVSNAFLSVVMDKKARDKFNAAQDAKKRAMGELPASPAIADDDTDIPRMIPTAADTQPARPSKPAAPTPTVAPKPPSSGPADDTAMLVRQALDSAEAELTHRQNRKSMSPERQALIENALAIHRSKAHILDDLDEDQREKLYVMAMQTLNDQNRE